MEKHSSRGEAQVAGVLGGGREREQQGTEESSMRGWRANRQSGGDRDRQCVRDPGSRRVLVVFKCGWRDPECATDSQKGRLWVALLINFGWLAEAHVDCLSLKSV